MTKDLKKKINNIILKENNQRNDRYYEDNVNVSQEILF